MNIKQAHTNLIALLEFENALYEAKTYHNSLFNSGHVPVDNYSLSSAFINGVYCMNPHLATCLEELQCDEDSDLENFKKFNEEYNRRRISNSPAEVSWTKLDIHLNKLITEANNKLPYGNKKANTNGRPDKSDEDDARVGKE